jgi:hypothetical protein
MSKPRIGRQGRMDWHPPGYYVDTDLESSKDLIWTRQDRFQWWERPRGDPYWESRFLARLKARQEAYRAEARQEVQEAARREAARQEAAKEAARQQEAARRQEAAHKQEVARRWEEAAAERARREAALTAILEQKARQNPQEPRQEPQEPRQDPPPRPAQEARQKPDYRAEWLKFWNRPDCRKVWAKLQRLSSRSNLACLEGHHQSVVTSRANFFCNRLIEERWPLTKFSEMRQIPCGVPTGATYKFRFSEEEDE